VGVGTTIGAVALACAETQRLRRGFNTKRAKIAPIQSKAIARMKIGIQLPVAPFNTLPRGTSSDAVPFAV